MASVFALLSAVPGAERELLERLAAYPGVVDRQLLFGEQIAVRLDEGQLPAAQGLAGLQGVREARLYHQREAWVVKGRAGS